MRSSRLGGSPRTRNERGEAGDERDDADADRERPVAQSPYDERRCFVQLYGVTPYHSCDWWP